MVHERISVTARRAEFLSWRDTELLFSTVKPIKTHKIKNKNCIGTILLNMKMETKSLVG